MLKVGLDSKDQLVRKESREIPDGLALRVEQDPLVRKESREIPDGLALRVE